MAAVTDFEKLDNTFENVWESSQKVLKPSHPIKIKVM